MAFKLIHSETNHVRLPHRLFAGAAFICLLIFGGFARAQQCHNLFEIETKAQPHVAPVRPAQQTKAGWDRKNLRVATFNAQDFTLYEKADSKLSRATPKSDKLAKAAAKTLFDANPDIIVLQEIGSKYSLQKLADLSSNEKYDAVLIQGHDTPDLSKGAKARPARHIGFLIKKSLILEHTIATNLRIPYTGTDPKRKYLFDRGLPVISFFEPNNKIPLFSVIGVHNHSLGEQAKFSDLKHLEEKSMVAVIQKLQEAYGTQFPIVLAGDFNTEVNGKHRLTGLKSKMAESFDELKIESTSPKRVSQIIFQKPNQISSLARQIDGIFVSSALSGRVTYSQTLQFSIEDVSDHKPIVVDINLEGAIP